MVEWWRRRSIDAKVMGLGTKYFSPFAERLVGHDQRRTALVAHADELEQHAGLGLGLADVGDVIEDRQMLLVELGRSSDTTFTSTTGSG
jgi:hypothetical protein